MNRLENAGYVAIEKTFVGKRPRTVHAPTAGGRAAFEKYRQMVGDLLSDRG